MDKKQELDVNAAMRLLNETCNEMAKKIQRQQKEIRRLRREREESIERTGKEAKNFRVN